VVFIERNRRNLADSKSEKDAWPKYTIQLFARHFFDAISYAKLPAAKAPKSFSL